MASDERLAVILKIRSQQPAWIVQFEMPDSVAFIGIAFLSSYSLSRNCSGLDVRFEEISLAIPTPLTRNGRRWSSRSV